MVGYSRIKSRYTRIVSVDIREFKFYSLPTIADVKDGIRMNIFVLDRSAETCARYHCDQHVIKMILESVQILCTALSMHGFATPYSPTHAKHPCVLWVASSYANFLWLKKLAMELNKEYRYRYVKSTDHKSIAVLKQLRGFKYADRGMTPFVQAMPEQYRVADDPVRAYRTYYIGEKLKFAKWRRRRPPFWIPAEKAGIRQAGIK
jgi:hypothetical protein